MLRSFKLITSENKVLRVIDESIPRRGNGMNQQHEHLDLKGYNTPLDLVDNLFINDLMKELIKKFKIDLDNLEQGKVVIDFTEDHITYYTFEIFPRGSGWEAIKVKT